ncbi:hypothetical protein Val02_52680 [Virgisporangium aliadipatigenens]|uniref:Tetratricopeptide repeat protein n=1 Tax=Virgisporangium aliadipatigenens TaxID=741659 RepID=A0A8J3YQ23_9ACTN|nr:tetratricopeptide repeat protein [Virgisporangium aliadipatigenens]GIJ48382.1 hypothetical protein Val02_52680 [Virgisporangium aliadipatigenens]
MDHLIVAAKAAFDAHDWPRATHLYERLATEHPTDPRVADWWYDAALAQKFLRNWPEAHRLGRHAVAHTPAGTQDPAYWNLGIAATIQRDWPTARAAWGGFGIPVAPGEGPIMDGYGRACVRLTGVEGQEVVWIQRLCPTRGRVLNVPFDTSRRFGEIVVHDGEPTGQRVVGERTFSVFDELVLFEPSDLPTLSVTVRAAEPADLEALADLFGERELGFEPLANGQVLCACCSTGSVESPPLALAGTQRCLLAAPLSTARDLLSRWSSAGRSWSDLHLAT